MKSTSLFFSAVLFFLCLGSIANAQVQTPRNNVSIINNCGGYYEYLPQGYNSNGTQTYPLIVFIHGIGELGDGNSQLPNILNCWTALPRLIANGGFPTSFTVGGQSFSFIVISPQFKTWPTSGDVNAVVDYAVQNYKVDQSRIYVTGLSMGGGAVWDFAAAYPTKAAAIVPICGASYPDVARGQVIANSKLPVWATHNQNDPTVSSSNTTGWVNNINQYGGNAQMTIFPVSGHDAWSKTYDPNFTQGGLNIYQWMLQYQKGSVSTNKPPVANAGANQTITLPTNTVTLSGSGTDADGTIASYQWSQISGPSQASIVSASSASTAVNNLVQGTYIFSLKVTDNGGAIGTSSVSVTVNAAPNQPPTANAGQNQTITLPTNSASLSGTGSDPDGSIVNVQWSQSSGPSQATFLSTSWANTSVSGLVQGSYVFTFKVTDNGGATATSNVTITVNSGTNQPPVANAGADQTITLPLNSVTLSGSGTDADGTIASYQWSQVSGPSQAGIASASSAQTSITALVQGSYTFRLTVTDNKGATATDDVIINVNAAPNQPPVANAGADQTITLPLNSVTLSGSGTDADGTIASYQWSQVSGPSQAGIASASSAQTSITALVQGSYTFRLTVTDNKGATATDDVIINVNAAPNQPPVANAGADQTITLPLNSVTLSGSGTDADGTIASYQWSQVSGPSQAGIASASAAQTSITALVQGSYTFRLTVTDNKGATATDDVIINVNAAPNQPPVANAGADQTITLPLNSVTLSGSGTDADGTIASYQWSQVSGPSQAGIASASSAQTSITALVQGSYTFRLTVTDNKGATATDDVIINVNAAPNQPPVANAGADQTITLPLNSVTLSGSGTDADGTIASYQWSQVSGPSQAGIASASSAQTSITALVQGSYTFRLTVTDNKGATATDDVIINVNAAPNQPPVANAGADQTITLPLNSVTLSGSGTDADGTIASYQWSQVSGPSQAGIASASSAQTSITALVQGSYTFRLTVTDNKGATATDDVIINVNAAPNQPPVANAGADQTITLPLNSVTLSGSGTDADGTIASYQWSQVSGPSQAGIASASSAQTSITALVQGSYTFRLTVTDNKGATATDDVIINVNAAPNQPPVANAGADQTITLPLNSVTLSGSGTDADGTIASYQWSQVSGPSQAGIASASSAQTSITALVQGSYTFRLTVTDNKGATATDDVIINVNAAPNQPPVANAGADQTITLPANSVILFGTGSDPDGSIVSYQWSQTAGPSKTGLSSISSSTAVGNLVEGIYVFQLEVTDNKGATATDDVTIIVKPDPRTKSTATIYPNPVSDILNVKIDAVTLQSNSSIRIVNASGSLVHAEEFMRTYPRYIKTINVSNLAKGVYFITITADINTSITLPFVKE